MGKIVKAGLRSRARGNLKLMMQRGTAIEEISTEAVTRPFVPFCSTTSADKSMLPKIRIALFRLLSLLGTYLCNTVSI